MWILFICTPLTTVEWCYVNTIYLHHFNKWWVFRGWWIRTISMFAKACSRVKSSIRIRGLLLIVLIQIIGINTPIIGIYLIHHRNYIKYITFPICNNARNLSARTFCVAQPASACVRAHSPLALQYTIHVLRGPLVKQTAENRKSKFNQWLSILSLFFYESALYEY